MVYNHNVAKQLGWFSECKQEIYDLQAETRNFTLLFCKRKGEMLIVFNACLYILDIAPGCLIMCNIQTEPWWLLCNLLIHNSPSWHWKNWCVDCSETKRSTTLTGKLVVALSPQYFRAAISYALAALSSLS